MPFLKPQTPSSDTAHDTDNAADVANASPLPADEADLLRRITDAAPLLLSYVDADLRYRFLNRTYTTWFGSERGKMLGHRISDVVGQAAFDRIHSHLATVLSGTAVAYENQMPYADGGHRYVRTSLIPDPDPETGVVRGFVGVVSDITSRHQAEERLAVSEARYRSLFEQSNDAVFSFDLQGNFVSANAASARISGYDIDELMQMTFVPLVVPEDTARTQARFVRALGGEVQSYEIAITHKAGGRVELAVTNVPIIVFGQIVGVYGIARDITEQKRAERLLTEASEKQRRFLREMLYSLTEGRLSLLDTPDALPPPLPSVGEPVALSRPSLRLLRRLVTATTAQAGIDGEHAQDFLTAAGEAAMNAVVHAGGGEATVCADDETGIVQVWVRDSGAGINEDDLHRATLEKGFTTAGTLGHGFWMMLKTADRVHLLTGPTGTTVVLEQERAAPEPLWLRDK